MSDINSNDREFELEDLEEQKVHCIIEKNINRPASAKIILDSKELNKAQEKMYGTHTQGFDIVHGDKKEINNQTQKSQESYLFNFNPGDESDSEKESNRRSDNYEILIDNNQFCKINNLHSEYPLNKPNLRYNEEDKEEMMVKVDETNLDISKMIEEQNRLDSNTNKQIFHKIKHNKEVSFEWRVDKSEVEYQNNSESKTNVFGLQDHSNNSQSPFELIYKNSNKEEMKVIPDQELVEEN